MNFDLQRFGDWFHTCGITNLPIEPGSKVLAVIIRQQITNLTGEAFTSTDTIFRPITLPLVGTMNSYGRLENVNSNSIVNKYLQNLMNNDNTLYNNYLRIIEGNLKGIKSV